MKYSNKYIENYVNELNITIRNIEENREINDDYYKYGIYLFIDYIKDPNKRGLYINMFNNEMGTDGINQFPIGIGRDMHKLTTPQLICTLALLVEEWNQLSTPIELVGQVVSLLRHNLNDYQVLKILVHLSYFETILIEYPQLIHLNSKSITSLFKLLIEYGTHIDENNFNSNTIMLRLAQIGIHNMSHISFYNNSAELAIIAQNIQLTLHPDNIILLPDKRSSTYVVDDIILFIYETMNKLKIYNFLKNINYLTYNNGTRYNIKQSTSPIIIVKVLTYLLENNMKKLVKLIITHIDSSYYTPVLKHILDDKIAIDLATRKLLLDNTTSLVELLHFMHANIYENTPLGGFNASRRAETIEEE